MRLTAIDGQLPKIHSMGNLIFDPIWAEREHMSGGCELIHVISGDVTVVMRRKRVAAKPGDTIIVPSQTIHRDDFPMGTKLEVFMVHFRWPWEKEFFSMVPVASLPGLPTPAKDTVSRLVHNLRLEFTAGAPRDDLLTRVRLAEVLLKLLESSLFNSRSRQKSEPAASDYGKQRREWLMSQAKAFIEGNYQRPISLDEVAKHLRVSPYHLSHVFSSESGFLAVRVPHPASHEQGALPAGGGVSHRVRDRLRGGLQQQQLFHQGLPSPLRIPARPPPPPPHAFQEGIALLASSNLRLVR